MLHIFGTIYSLFYVYNMITLAVSVIVNVCDYKCSQHHVSFHVFLMFFI